MGHPRALPHPLPRTHLVLDLPPLFTLHRGLLAIPRNIHLLPDLHPPYPPTIALHPAPRPTLTRCGSVQHSVLVRGRTGILLGLAEPVWTALAGRQLVFRLVATRAGVDMEE